MCKTNSFKNKINFCFFFKNKQYFYKKYMKIFVSKKCKLKTNDIIITKNIFFLNKKIAIFKIEKILNIKERSIKFKRRKRYKKIFGYKKKYIIINLIYVK
ncbi:hypothetical protein ONB67_00505 [Candidatus Vidania fulgoroideae]|uniref:50S ribosomal protein L21 n=1 Tax=Candidatus Vidania fulgoroideorum TaxID=881286 RepID=A0AAX3N9U9_9PROT|nr:hypothetical protein ONB67_00505 [Candidatus Vidania fulgoroideae]